MAAKPFNPLLNDLGSLQYRLEQGIAAAKWIRGLGDFAFIPPKLVLGFVLGLGFPLMEKCRLSGCIGVSWEFR